MARKRKKKGSKRIKPELTLSQMLARVPEGKWLNTTQVCYVWNECWPLRIYQLVSEGRLKKYKTRNRGKENLYKRDDVIRLVKDRFTPRPG